VTHSGYPALSPSSSAVPSSGVLAPMSTSAVPLQLPGHPVVTSSQKTSGSRPHYIKVPNLPTLATPFLHSLTLYLPFLSPMSSCELLSSCASWPLMLFAVRWQWTSDLIAVPCLTMTRRRTPMATPVLLLPRVSSTHIHHHTVIITLIVTHIRTITWPLTQPARAASQSLIAHIPQ